jgi:hypothetical protein
VAALLLAAYAAALGIAFAPHLLGDDAAITFRYAERIAAGKGFSYNDHERVLGASNALYVLVLAGIVRLGLAPETAARVLGLAVFVAGILMAARLTARLSTLGAGLLAGALLAADDFFRELTLCGMESGVAVLLGLFVVDALASGREALAGFLLGLALWNKLDAALLAAALAGATLLVARRFPYRTAGAAFLTVLPWWIFASFYFGSPIPQSFLAKWSDAATDFAPHRWVLGFLAGRSPHLLAAATCAWLLPAGGAPRLAAVALLGWVVLHGLACSLVNLGAPYSWYLTVLVPGPLILACALVARRRVLALLLVAAGSLAPVLATVRDAVAGHPIRAPEAFDADRRLAGVFLDLYAAPGEVVESGYGWVAYESHRPFNDGTNLNSVRWLDPAAYFVHHGSPHDRGSHPPAVPEGYVPVASFDLASQLFPGYSWFTVFGRPDSRIVREGKRHLVVRLADLSPQPGGSTILVPAERQRVRLVFTPWVAPSQKSEPVTFEVRRGSEQLLRRQVSSGDAQSPLRVELAQGGAADTFEISLLTDGAPGTAAAWRDVRLLVGDAEPDAARLGDRRLIEAWLRYH